MANHHRTAILTVLTLTLLGSACVLARFTSGRKPLPLHTGQVWRLSYEITMDAPAEGARIAAALPDSTPRARIVRESFTHPGFAKDIVRGRLTRGREARGVTLRRGSYLRFVAEFDILLGARGRSATKRAGESLAADARAHWLRAEKDIQLTDAAVTKALADLAGEKADKSQLLKRFYQHCSESISGNERSQNSDAASALADGVANRLGRARAMVALCRAAHIPARLVSGFALAGHGPVSQRVWVEAFDKKQWIPYDPENGYERELPLSYLAVRRDGTQVVRISGATDHRVRYTAWRSQPLLGTIGGSQKGVFDVVDLTRLPWAMQRTLSLLLLLPVGAIITALFRNFVGIETFGTFTPSLLALSLVDAHWLTGLFVFAVILSIGLGGRVFLNRLRLLMVPRLSIVLTLVVLSLTLGVSILFSLGLTPTAHSVLLPMVILTMTVERFHVSAEEDSLTNSLKLLSGTLVVGACCLFVLRWETLGLLILTLPEIHLFTASGLVLIGRYQGYRLLELWRFRDLARTTAVGG